jgi:hypothetical protein
MVIPWHKFLQRGGQASSNSRYLCRLGICSRTLENINNLRYYKLKPWVCLSSSFRRPRDEQRLYSRRTWMPPRNMMCLWSKPFLSTPMTDQKKEQVKTADSLKQAFSWPTLPTTLSKQKQNLNFLQNLLPCCLLISLSTLATRTVITCN